MIGNSLLKCYNLRLCSFLYFSLPQLYMVSISISLATLIQNQCSFAIYDFIINLINQMHSLNFQTGDETGQQESNCKVYISNINKNIDESTLRRKFEEFGSIRSLILKKKPNDVTYSFIEYASSSGASAAVNSLNGQQVWERVLKVEYGKGGKRGFRHYLTDEERDRRFGQNRRQHRVSSSSRSRISNSKERYYGHKKSVRKNSLDKHSSSYSQHRSHRSQHRQSDRHHRRHSRSSDHYVHEYQRPREYERRKYSSSPSSDSYYRRSDKYHRSHREKERRNDSRSRNKRHDNEKYSPRKYSKDEYYDIQFERRDREKEKYRQKRDSREKQAYDRYDKNFQHDRYRDKYAYEDRDAKRDKHHEQKRYSPYRRESSRIEKPKLKSVTVSNPMERQEDYSRDKSRNISSPYLAHRYSNPNKKSEQQKRTEDYDRNKSYYRNKQ